MGGPSGKGVGITSANAPKTHQIKHTDSTNDEGVGKAFDTLHEMSDRGYFVACGNLSQQLPDLRAVRQMLVQIGGRQ